MEGTATTSTRPALSPDEGLSAGFSRSSRALRLGILAGVLGLLALLSFGLRDRLPVAEYYVWLSTPSIVLSGPLGDLTDALNVPLISALLLGLIGAISPCQISTNVAALAYTSREVEKPHRMALAAGAYVLGKMSVYTLLGVAVIGLGLQLNQASIPVIVAARKALGPLLILIGLMMLGVIQLKVSAGQRIGSWFEARAAGRGVFGSYLLGVAFSFAFCPTLFWLFFGLLVPLALASTGGFAYPPLFALGTSVPLLFFAGMTALGAGSASGFFRQARRFDRWAQTAVGLIFLLVGFNEFILYWLI
jgi:cytochrome c biogenesis protein CcdA